MIKFLLKLSNYHNLLLKLASIPLAALCIVYFFPGGQKFRYEFREGSVWMYPDLTAPFDFPIQKTKEELEKEKMILIENSPVFLKYDPLVATKEISDMKSSLSSESTKDVELSIKILQDVYEKGVYSGELDGTSFLVNSTEHPQTHRVQNFLTIETATTYIKDQLQQKLPNKDLISISILKHLRANLELDANKTRRFRDNELNYISPYQGKVIKKDLIISKGETIRMEQWKILESLRNESQKRFPDQDKLLIFAGKFLLVLIALSLLIVFLLLFRKDVFADNKKIFFFLFLISSMTIVYNWSIESSHINAYIVPLCILPIMVRTFFDTRLALYSHLVLILILGFIAPDGIEFAFIQLSSGMAAIFTIVNLRRRSQFFYSSAVIFIVSSLSWISMELIKEGSFVSIDYTGLKWFAANAFMTLLTYPLIFLTEKSFGFISDVSLLELSDSNSPLLRELATRAPGTFQHSLQVANLAEAVIYQIGGNTLMIRAGALYHDIGKMKMPVYFIENQVSSVNPHDELPFEESAEIIIGHVISGIEIAKKHGLPEQLIDFIRTHHGEMRVQYFYRSYIKNFPDELVDENKFRYPGPLPFSKETAVLMMADSVEAAARSLKKPDEERIEKLVDSVIDNLIVENQFINCDITFRDISIIKKIFRKMLSSIYHSRVEYN